MSSPFIRKLRREIKSNPKKTGALGLLLLVAGWFWTPLVAGWFGGGAPEATNVTETTANNPSTNSAVNVAQPATVGSTHNQSVKSKHPTREHNWRQVVQRMEEDPRTMPTNDLSRWRDPFGPSVTDLAASKKQTEKPVDHAKSEPAVELKPGEAGLVLNSTIVGAERRMALISGEPYSEGSLVPAVHGTGDFRLIEIRSRLVILERNGKRYSLELNLIEVAQPQR